MDTIGESLYAAAEDWLNGFDTALTKADRQALSGLFLPDSHWRDLLAFTWHVTTVSGPADIAEALCRHAEETGADNFRLDESDAPVRFVIRGGREDVVEAIYAFETTSGPAQGVFRLLPDENDSTNLSGTWKV